MIKKTASLILILIFLSSCDINTSNTEQAQQALISFFSELSNGNYANAEKLYGSSYEILATFNPDMDAEDHAALWKNGCQVNGFQCLTIRTITSIGLTENGEYSFLVEFNADDGNLFILEACCSENPTTTPQFQFEYRVVEGRERKMKVLDLPVYIP